MVTFKITFTSAVPFSPSVITTTLAEGLKKGLGDFEVVGFQGQVLGKLLPVFCSVYCFYQEYYMLYVLLNITTIYIRCRSLSG